MVSELVLEMAQVLNRVVSGGVIDGPTNEEKRMELHEDQGLIALNVWIPASRKQALKLEVVGMHVVRHWGC